MTKLLTRDEILQAQDVRREVVPVPEWGGDVLVTSITGSDRDAIEVGIGEDREAKRVPRFRARVVAACVVNEQGERLFTEADVEALGRKSAAALDRVFDVATRINAFTKKDVAELEKN